MDKETIELIITDIILERFRTWQEFNPDTWGQLVTEWHRLTGFDPKVEVTVK